jgi:hypothetical protein
MEIEMTTINIKNQELVRKIKEVADKKHKGITATLNEVIDKELAQPEPVGEDDPIVQHVLEIARRNRERFPNALRSDQIDEFLYDEDGLPK